LWANQEIRINMTKNMTRKGLAFGAGLALIASGLGVAPATAAVGEFVTLKPISGSKLGSFTTDTFSLDSRVSVQLNSSSTAFRIDNPDQDLLKITLGKDDNDDDGDPDQLITDVDITGETSTGSYITLSAAQVLDGNASDDGSFVVDMKEAGVVSLILSGMNFVDNDEARTRISVQPIASVTDTGTREVQAVATLTITDNAAYVLTLATEPAAVTFTTGGGATIGEIVIGLNALIQAGNGSAVITSEAVVQPGIIISYLVSGDITPATLSVAAGAETVTTTTAGNSTTVTTNLVDFSGNGNVKNGVFELDVANDVVAELAYGTGDKSVTVTSWVESENVADYETVDAPYSSLPQTITWYDPKGVVVVPRIERINAELNDKANTLHASVEFNKPINLEQLDSSQWTMDVTTGELPAFANDIDLTAAEIEPLGLTNADAFGRYAFATDVTNIAINTSYTVSIHSKLAQATNVERWYSSTGYSISNGTATATMVVEPQITDTADVDYTGITPPTGVANGTGTLNSANASIRSGVKSVTYASQLQSANPLADDTSVSVPMLAVVTNGSFMPAGSSISVQGNASAMTLADEVRMVTGFTDSKGQFDVTVISSVAHKSETYNVAFYVLRAGIFINQYTAAINGGTGADVDAQLATIAASYSAADATATSLTAVNSVVAGAEVTASFTVKDQFGSAISKTAAGKQLNLSIESADKANLDKNVAVSADGEVSFTFTNYLTTGSSDLLTATLYTGSSSDKTVIDTATLTLYNTGATGAVQVPKTLLGSVTYDDYIADGAKVVTGVTVDPDQDIELTGTVVDANGVGIPAAVVIISAPGMQIQEEGSTKYYMDTHTINANSAGVFDVNLNAHMVNTTGVDVTVTTADGKTATTVVKTYLPEDTGLAGATLNGDNLVFTMDTPANVVMNKTYAVTAKLTDKWGNPVKTSATAVKLQGAGSFELNGVSTEISKDFDANGEALVYLRSVKDIAGPGTLLATLEGATYTALDVSTGLTAATVLRVAETTTNVVTTVWDETVFTNTFGKIVQVLTSEADIVTAQKVNAGSFKGYVALYAKGYEGQRMSAKVGNDWVIVPAIPAATNDLFRAVEFVGAGVEISVRLYIDRVLVATIPLLTK
jgi:hypothetical protein